MSIFDLFGGEPRRTRRTGKTAINNGVITPPQEKMVESGPVSIFFPSSYGDVEKIIDVLKGGKTAVVHLSAVKPETAIRIIDMLSGAVYALSGGVYEMDKNVFMFSPTGVEMR